MKKILVWLMLLALAVAGCAETTDPAEQAAGAILPCFLNGESETVADMLSDEVRASVGLEALQSAWEQTASMGALTGTELSMEQGFAVVSLAFERGSAQLVVGLNEDGRVTTLLLRPVVQQTVERELPEGASARTVVLFEGTERALNAELIVPAGECSTYAVLIHGSGPSNMDETVGGCKPFRDLAYDLAASGVGSLRFDKITYAHPELGAETVTDEYLTPVQEALRVLKAETGAARTVAIGHSEGGMLMPWLVTECGFDAGAALAGTPRTLWEISYAQNLAVLESMIGEQRDAVAAQVEAERVRAENLDALADDETLFGAPVKYQRSIAELDEIALALKADVPMLFLWGEADFQVGREDFEAWQQGLSGSDKCAFISYPGLNHLFMPAQEGDSILNASAVYARAAQMDPQVAADIAAWLAD